MTLSDEDRGGFSPAEVEVAFKQMTGRFALSEKDQQYLSEISELCFSTDATIFLMGVIAGRAQKRPGSMRYFYVSLNELHKQVLDTMIEVMRDVAGRDLSSDEFAARLREATVFFRALVEVRKLIDAWCHDRFAFFHDTVRAK